MGSASASASKEGEEWVLSQGDVVLIRSDLAILRGPRFINDRIIAFYFAYLSAGHHSDDLLLLPPSIPLPPLQPPRPGLRRRRRRTAWPPSLRAAPTGPSSSSTAPPAPPRPASSTTTASAARPTSRLADALRPLLQCGSATVPLVQGHTPRQTNGYDCGVYVMAIARAICAWWNDAQHHRGRGGDWLEAVRREVDARSVKAMRTDPLQLINTLIQEKAKPNSTSEAEGHTDRGSSD